ncbi:MAG: DUF47 family protein [Bacteroidales bacterium]|nr:DUF47 family protein [Bacteroidales bacterium]
MKLDQFLQLFVVKEKTFFPLFIQLSDIIEKGAGILLDTTKETDHDSRMISVHRVKECETAGDDVTDKILDELEKAFVTPFDREDIHKLASMMDTLMDMIHDCANKIAIYQPKESDAKIVQIANFILEDAALIKEIMLNMENLRKKTEQVSDLCDKIKEIEHIVDDIYESYMSYIFKNEKDTVELIKKKNIVQALEDTTDHAKALTDAVRTILVKIS